MDLCKRHSGVKCGTLKGENPPPIHTCVRKRSCGHSVCAWSRFLQSGRLTSTSSQLSCQGCSFMDLMPEPFQPPGVGLALTLWQ